MVEGEEGFKDLSIVEFVEKLSNVFKTSILPKLKSIQDETKRYLFFIAWLNEALEKEGLGRIVITGGFAVEVYTARVYRTMDVDVIVEGVKADEVVEKFLESFSERLGRGYLPTYETLTLKSIDLVSTTYSRKKPPTTILIEGMKAYLDPLEDLIVSYLSGWKFWNATEDRDKALWLLAGWIDKIDLNYLEEVAKEKNVYDKLLELTRLITS
ncbi:MAG: hypothetical protein B7O98_08490 [Zestosphaera tikiterensis]|uniref:DUF6036 domain-containing protein n=1 Tax=Zestosphaera tikiterensis TaxID=1973259 RepID=A0A2R7Y2T1_9CREN|nr:MAG: hypothetical protein B7O98_08490 [Zestosphaera tikiterensis]